MKELSAELIEGGYNEDTPAAIVYKATWPEQKVLRCTVGTLEQTAREADVTKTALIVVGEVLDGLMRDQSFMIRHLRQNSDKHPVLRRN